MGGRLCVSWFLLSFFLLLPGSLLAADFEVFSESQLLDALASAAANGQSDTIRIGPGTLDGSILPFIYDSSEDASITIIGVGIGHTVLDGGGEALPKGLGTHLQSSLLSQPSQPRLAGKRRTASRKEGIQ